MRDLFVVCVTLSAIYATVRYVKWRTGSIYKDTQEQYSFDLGEE